MEMEFDYPDYNGNSTEETSLHELSPPDSPHKSDLFGDQQANPRIGDEFQVNIPPMITGTEYIQLLVNPTDPTVTFDVSHSFIMGLPIPIVWLHDEVNNIDDAARTDESFKCKKSKKGQINIGRRGPKLNASELCVRLKARKESKPENLEAKIAGRTNLDRLCKCANYSPVPGLLGDSWSDAEKEFFLLGLYIFGKNFFQIKRFIETKEMGDLLSYYYGEFYRSNEHHRWTDCRKPRSRKCVYGRKIFTGWRQQELLSRLLTHVPEESHNSLLEASKSFAEGRTSLDIYVSYLKATVGLSALIESVGIGKGKEDLTSLSMEPVKINQVFPVCPKMPCGKACSSLTSSDIIKFLTGGFRLSKARCNDIFWEAVWPRLLARGWHSEQPKNQGYITSKDYLVFLMPGIKKFSRRKLVKGDHYFDSVSDILNKVASEPKLLELEAEESRVSSFNGEDQWVAEDLSDQDDPSNRQPHCYLKPRTSNCNSEHMKFMVVDSSLVHGGKSSKVRELRFLPVDFKGSSKMTGLSRENKGYFENFLDEHKLGAANIPLNVEKKTVHHTPHPPGCEEIRRLKSFSGLPKEFRDVTLTCELVPESANFRSLFEEDQKRNKKKKSTKRKEKMKLHFNPRKRKAPAEVIAPHVSLSGIVIPGVAAKEANSPQSAIPIPRTETSQPTPPATRVVPSPIIEPAVVRGLEFEEADPHQLRHRKRNWAGEGTSNRCPVDREIVSPPPLGGQPAIDQTASQQVGHQLGTSDEMSKEEMEDLIRPFPVHIRQNVAALIDSVNPNFYKSFWDYSPRDQLLRTSIDAFKVASMTQQLYQSFEPLLSGQDYNLEEAKKTIDNLLREAEVAKNENAAIKLQLEEYKKVVDEQHKKKEAELRHEFTNKEKAMRLEITQSTNALRAKTEECDLLHREMGILVKKLERVEGDKSGLLNEKVELMTDNANLIAKNHKLRTDQAKAEKYIDKKVNEIAWELAVNLLQTIWEANKEADYSALPEDYHVEIARFTTEAAGLPFTYPSDYDPEGQGDVDQPDLKGYQLESGNVHVVPTEDQPDGSDPRPDIPPPS